MYVPDCGVGSNIIMYTTEDGLTKIETTFDGDTVWLSIDQMAELFQRDRSVIGKHVRNIFKEGELKKESVWTKFADTTADGKVYDVDYYKRGYSQVNTEQCISTTLRRGILSQKS